MLKYLAVCLPLTLVAGAAFAAAKYDLEKIRKDDEQLYAEWSIADWDNCVFGKEADIESLLKKYEYLSADPELLTFIQEQEKAAPDALTARRLHLLYRDLATTYEANQCIRLDDDINTREATDKIWVVGLEEPVAIRDVYPLKRQTDDETAYKNLWYASGDYEINVINPLRRERLAKHDETTKAMGYKNYTDFYYQVLGYAPGEPEAQARRFREETFPVYKEIITARCRQLFKTDPAETPPWKSKNLWFGKEYDKYFPKENMLPFTYGFFAGLGMDIRTLPNVKVDDTDRPEKDSRAATFPVAVPADIRVNLKAIGGGEDYETAFHEFGHALHSAYTDPNLPFELRMLGSNELTETYAIFFQNLFSDQTFLLEEVKMPPKAVDEYLYYRLGLDMSSARSTAFDVIYDPELHSGELADPMARCKELTDEQRLFPEYPIDTESYYLYVDEGFYALYYMSAFYGAAQLKAKMVEKFGPRWYKDPAAGEMLKGLFKQGDALAIDDMLKQIGYAEGLNPDYLAADYKARYEALKKK